MILAATPVAQIAVPICRVQHHWTVMKRTAPVLAPVADHRYVFAPDVRYGRSFHREWGRTSRL